MAFRNRLERAIVDLSSFLFVSIDKALVVLLGMA